MKLSVVTAVRNGEPYLRQAIESVLAQSVTDFEFLIVDDASEDATPDILSEYQKHDERIRVWRNETNRGPYDSANRALTEARGTFVTRHDADDTSPPDRFAIQLEPLESDPDVSLVLGAIEVFTEGSNESSVLHPTTWQPRLEWELLFGNAALAGAHPMFPRAIAGQPMLFPAKHPYAEDYGLWCRLSRLGRVVCPTQVVYRYRRHGASISSRKRVEQHDCMAAIRREYQAPYLAADVSIADLSIFWTVNARRRLTGSIKSLYAVHAELRPRFLSYVEERYGRSERVALEADLDEAMSERLGYWMYRSLRLIDAKACADLISIARDRQEALDVSAMALGRVASAVLDRLPSTYNGRHHGERVRAYSVVSLDDVLGDRSCQPATAQPETRAV